MGIWLDALVQAAAGQADEAVDLVRSELHRSLVTRITESTGTLEYAGELNDAVRAFASRQSTVSKRKRLESYRREIVDMIIDDISDEVLRNIALVETCRVVPPSTLDELAHSYPWAAGLKRNREWKRTRVADLLRSMLGENIDLPAWVNESLGSDGEKRFEFDERKAAIDSERIKLTCSSFRRLNDLDREVLSGFDDEFSNDVGAESVDYDALRVARQAVARHRHRRLEDETVLHFLGTELQPELIALVEEHHGRKPSDGFRPIAWHSVYWTVESEWEGLRMSLPSVDPYCDGDGTLAEFIALHYEEVSSTSRPVICRRRLTLQDECQQHIHRRIAERFDVPVTQLSSQESRRQG